MMNVLVGWFVFSLPPLGSYFLTAKSNKSSRLLIFLLKKALRLIGTTRKIRGRKLA
jgi:hypothetical protein